MSIEERATGMTGWSSLRNRRLSSYLTAIVLVALIPTMGSAMIAVWWAVGAFTSASADRLVVTARTISQGIYSELQSNIASLENLALDPLLKGVDPAVEASQLREIETQFGGRLVVVHRPETDRTKALRQLEAAGIPANIAELMLTKNKSSLSDIFTPTQGGKPSIAVAVRISPNTTVSRTIVWYAPARRVVRSLQRGGAEQHRLLAAVTDSTGRIVARSRDPEQFIGNYVPNWANLKAVSNDEGVFEAKTLEGGKIMFSFRRVPGTSGWMVVVGEPLTVVQARWMQPVLGLLAVCGVAIAIGMLMVRRLMKVVLAPVQALARRAEAVAAGGGLLQDLSVPPVPKSSVTEFEAMRQSLEASETALRQQALEIAKSERRYRCLAETGALVFWTRALSGELTTTTGWRDLTAQSEAAALGNGWLDMVHPADVVTVETAWLRATAIQGDIDVEFRVRSQSGVWHWVRARGTLFSDGEGKMPEWIGVLEDVNERRESELKVAEMALRDSLTGLANRVVFRQKVQEAAASARPDRICALHYVDLDRFKAVNDTLGHPAGDALLASVAERLLSLVDEKDTVARLGGDEFAIV